MSISTTNDWHISWQLKTLTYEDIFKLVSELIVKQLEVERKQIKLSANMEIDYEADSVDIAGMLLALEDMYKKASHITQIAIPTDKLNDIVLVEDLFNLIYDLLVQMQNKLDSADIGLLTPDYKVLDKQKKIGKIYPDNENN